MLKYGVLGLEIGRNRRGQGVVLSIYVVIVTESTRIVIWECVFLTKAIVQSLEEF